ncbi:glycolate oxidase subunit GlcE [Microvirga thermotolerans]|uniref:Glycolate oxidase subunit GlcE n=1 Tax=Microvirga thermotolerans TaxID=2651334 RepID=A0A5P9JW67_9HYPH|nr:glycolate oxidase subunit GlcE [Microvirga thermotolerans]QFU15680.1 glycolate oxidase subunit GlcE [Microvirga thermotolerans]
MSSLIPRDEQDAASIVAQAKGRGTLLNLCGNGTKASMGRPSQTDATLSAAALTGITLYEPAELVISARSGTPLSEVVDTLAGQGQQLPFEPMDYRPLLGSQGEPTIGSVAAMNISGPRRIMAGAARDSLIGVRFVNGRGEVIKSGGRVMKNVTGLDLVKLMAGSWGTLGFLTEVTFKVLPRPERMSTLLIRGLDDGSAVAALSAALGSPFDVTGAAHLPAPDRQGARTLIRLEGFSVSVDYRLNELRRLLKRFGAADILEGRGAEAVWQSVRDATVLQERADRAVWRVSTAPTRGPSLVARVAAAVEAQWFYDWGGGLVWIATPAEGDLGAGAIRAATRELGGHAMLVRAPDADRSRLDVFEPQPEAVMALTRGIKASFDPAGILNPGRMYAGI